MKKLLNNITFIKKLLNKTTFMKKLLNNTTFIEIYGMRRTGNHAIIGWLKQNFDNKYGATNVVFLNDVVNNHSLKGDAFNIRINELIEKNTNVVIISYEDEVVEFSRLDSNIDRIKISLLRDIFNLSASRYKANTGSAMRIDEKFVERWINHATHNFLFKYEDFLLSKEERDRLCMKLDIDNLDITNNVHYCNNIGSSFVNKKLDTFENYLTRYKMVDFPNNIILIITTKEIMEIRNKMGYEPITFL